MAWMPDYCSVADLSGYLRIGDPADDAQLALAITAASRAVDRTTGRQFGQLPVAAARYYTPRFDVDQSRWVLDIDDLMTSAGLLVKADLDDNGIFTDSITSFSLKPPNAAGSGQPWTKLVVHPTSPVLPTSRRDSVEVTALFGWTSVPTAVKQACLLQASRLFTRRDAPFGVAGSPDTGSELRLLAKVDPDVAVILRPYTKLWWGV